jgi:hypothetical protein
MRSSLYLASLLACLVIGCEKKEDPRQRPGFIDTSDPSRIKETMIAPPQGPGSSPGGKATK